MRPVKNEKHGYRQPGDYVGSHRIIALSRCESVEECKRRYHNFEVACNGYRRVIEGREGPQCSLWVVHRGDEDYLADIQDGRPIE